METNRIYYGKTISWWYKHISKSSSNGYIIDLRNASEQTIAVWTTNSSTLTVYNNLNINENLYINGENYSSATYTLTDWNHFCLTVDATWHGDIFGIRLAINGIMIHLIIQMVT